MKQIVQEISDAQQLVQQGKEHYDAGLFSKAVESLQQASQLFKASKDELKQAITLSNLSLAYQQLGKFDVAEQAIEDGLRLLKPERNLGDRQKQLKAYAQSLNIRSRFWYLRGQPEEALKSSQKATDIYKQLGEPVGMIGSLLNQAQALQALGFYQQAKTMLEQVKQILAQTPDFTIKARGLRSLGNVLRAVGDLKQSQEVLEESLGVVERLPSPQAKGEAKSAALLSLGNTIRARGNLERDRLDTTTEQNSLPWRCVIKLIPDQAAKFYREAGQNYQQVIDESSSPTTRVQAQLNYLSLLLETEELPAAQALWPKIQIFDLPKSRMAVYAQINLARSLACLQQQKNISISPPLWEKIDNLLATAVQDARELEDPRAVSYALANRSGLYEYFAWLDEQYQQKLKAQEWIQKAQQLTQEALLLTQPIEAPDIAYQWQWQLGRLLQDQGKKEEAIAAYEAAVETLKFVRGDLLSVNSDVQFSFRDNVEPLYRELVALLLPPGETQPEQKNLEKSLKYTESLQLAELENFLRCNLLDAKPVQIDKVAEQEDPTAVVFYPIILKDRLEVILKLPNQLKLIRYQAPVKQIDLEHTLNELRGKLTNKYSGRDEYEPLSSQVYDWLIRPAEKYFNPDIIKTLVFVLDGSLRNIPMSALWDGKQFLIEKYAVTITPGLQLLGPKRLERKRLKALVAGLTKGGTLTIEGRIFNFSLLPNVGTEVDKIKKILPDSIELLDERFKTENLRSQLNSSSYPIVHLATHGNFSSNPQETFILTTSNNHININELQNLLQAGKQSRPDAIELLVFSACETATGDRRAALGLAGVAVRAGAGSTMATLWSVNDKSTALLIEQFYQNLKQELAQKQVTKAEVLKQAQLYLLQNINYTHPYYWSPFVLIGNWL
ncbi:CHAT domain-containing protein [Trichocoleus sp. FACHB-40]|uniref:CHAT domain-containing protein n=2 Tax=Cyanophyceae TaxID=3028117 RepID=UPI0018EF9077|nr:CHAT domain-containing protein [Trichocoleus sp. FACHB-40]